jgi:hypothetical protein
MVVYLGMLVRHTIMRTTEGCLRMKKTMIIALLVVVVIVAFVAYNLVQYNCSHFDYSTETKIYLEAFLGMECTFDFN